MSAWISADEETLCLKVKMNTERFIYNVVHRLW